MTFPVDQRSVTDAGYPVSGGRAGLQFLQLSVDDWLARIRGGSAGVLGIASLGQLVDGPPGVPQVCVQTPLLVDGSAVVEVWCGDAPVCTGQRGALYFSMTEALLFGAIELREEDFAATAGNQGGCPDTPLQRATESAYQQVFELLEELGYPHLLRVWNYLPAINDCVDGLERYRQFNIGRQDAFLACERSPTRGAPAACALGTTGGGLTVYFLAGRVAALPIENPRQVSAYHYPHRYGPRAPTFSRAALARLPGQEILFISGTASIVGHQTVHIGDVAAQTRETLENIRAVLTEANRVAARPMIMDDLLCKVYVRTPADLPVIRREIEAVTAFRVAPVYVQADVCRDDLLVEIEATAFAVVPA